MNLRRRLENRDNNFDVLRLVAAVLVLLSHCYPLTGHPEPFAELTGVTLGEVGVVMFFAMSGFLIAKSWTDEPQPGRYFFKRALRLLPALVVAVAFTTLIVGPLFTELPLTDYFTDPETWIYLIRASLLVTIAGQLPGVFEDNVYPEAVNGSLWTLPLEAGCYVMIVVLGLIGVLQRRALLGAAAAVVLLALTPLSPLPDGISHTAGGGNVKSVVELIATFLLGALLYSLRDRLRLSWLVPAVARRRVGGELAERVGDPDHGARALDHGHRLRLPHAAVAAAADGAGRRLLRDLRLRLPRPAVDRRAVGSGPGAGGHVPDRPAGHVRPCTAVVASDRASFAAAQASRSSAAARPKPRASSSGATTMTPSASRR